MELILADAKRMELAFIEEITSLDIELSSKETNDYELSMSRELFSRFKLNRDCSFFVPNTEYGGLLEEVETNTNSNLIIYRGYTWRGLLQQIIIEPPLGQAYKIVTGDAHDIIRALLVGCGVLFKVAEEKSGVTFTNYKFNRYTNLHDGLVKMLSSKGYKIRIRSMQGTANQPYEVYLEVTKIINHTEDLEFNGDDKVNVTIKDYKRGVNHLICLGKGELVERQVIHLYAQLDGSISQDKKYFIGKYERTDIYDYSNVESLEELISEGKKKLKELMDYKSSSMTIIDHELDIGDVVSSRDRDQKIIMSAPIVSKIIRIQDGIVQIEYKFEGSD